ncbi:MAG: signal peptidase I [Armatimonadetes bacterium]|nr:signal peptidase I [Armatimonadota bacterium]
MSSKRKWILGLAVPFGALALLLFPWRMCVVIGQSMEPFLRTGDVLVLNRFAKKEIQRGSVVVFKYKGITSIKKVHAVQGDKVAEVYYSDIGQSTLVQPSQEQRWRRLKKLVIEDTQAQLIHIRVPKDYIYVVGTGIATCDSRDFGLVPVSDVIGVVKYGPRRSALATSVGPETTNVPPVIEGQPLCPQMRETGEQNRT